MKSRDLVFKPDFSLSGEVDVIIFVPQRKRAACCTHAAPCMGWFDQRWIMLDDPDTMIGFHPADAIAVELEFQVRARDRILADRMLHIGGRLPFFLEEQG